MNRFVKKQQEVWRSLIKKPGFVATVISTMGISIGALLCILTLANLIIFKPLPYPDQDMLYKVGHDIYDKSNEKNASLFTYAGLIHLYKNQQVFEQTALVHYAENVLTSLSHQPTLRINSVTPEWFLLTKPRMLMGRTFEQSEKLDSNNPVAILSHHTWKNEFSSDPNILDKKVDFSGVSYRVVGVIDESFIEPRINPIETIADIWLPWDFNQDVGMKGQWGAISESLYFVGKLSSNYSPSQAEQKISTLINETWQDNVSGWEFFKGWHIELTLTSFKSAIVGESQKTVYMLIAGVVGLVLIALANITNLFLSRTAEKQRSLAIRAAMGATRQDLFRVMFSESSQLMGLSIIVALLLAKLGFYSLQQYLSDFLPRVNELSLNSFTLSLALMSVIFFAFIFAFISSRIINYKELKASLQSSGKGTGIQVSKKSRQVLITSQVAIVTTLIFINMNLFVSALKEINIPLGFNVESIYELNISYADTVMPSPEVMTALLDEAELNLSQLPQIEAISRSTSPLGRFDLWAVTEEASQTHYTPEQISTGLNYFQIVEQPLIEGDFFSKEDYRNSKPVMIINDVFAKRLNPNGSALGMSISTMGLSVPFRVIGVVKATSVPDKVDAPIRVYTPAPTFQTNMMIKVKSKQNLPPKHIINVLKEIDERLVIYNYQSLTELRDERLFSQYVTVITTTILTLLSLFLAGIGLYGILSYSTQMRKFELGTRMAIGAEAKDLVQLIFKDNTTGIFSGIAVSVLAMLALFILYSEVISNYAGGQLIPLFLLTLLFVALITFAACYLPLKQYTSKLPGSILRV